jgi:hypothetical protein
MAPPTTGFRFDRARLTPGFVAVVLWGVIAALELADWITAHPVSTVNFAKSYGLGTLWISAGLLFLAAQRNKKPGAAL